MSDVDYLIEKIHAAPEQAVVAVAGAGSQAVAWLLGVSGASRTLLEVVVPYGRRSMLDFLGYEPAQFVSSQTARELARAAYRRATRLREDDSPVVGLACTATIATDRPKRGDHRCCIAVWGESQVDQVDLVLDKGGRDRPGEEEVVSRLVVQTLADALGIQHQLDIKLTPAEHPQRATVPHAQPIQRLLAGDVDSVSVGPDGRMAVDRPVVGALLPGSFSPLHHGHQSLARAASEILQTPVTFELSVVNVDKAPLSEDEIRRRIGQFAGIGTLVLTRAPTFHQKARLFPGVTFVLGWDTAVRLVAPRYYGDSEEAMLTALAEMWAWGCRFLVGGRRYNGNFYTLEDMAIPQGFFPLFQGIPESSFRVDVSSTDLRSGSAAG